MTDENPYAPPKSTYYMQPEQDYQPTKGQKIMRIILGTLCVPLLMTIIEIGVMIWVSFVVNYQLRFFITFMTIFIGLYIISIVPNVIFTWILEKYCPTIGKKIICALQRIKFIPVSYYSKIIKEMTQINSNLLVILVYLVNILIRI